MEVRARLWLRYALDDDSIKVVLQWLSVYLEGLLTTALVCIRTDMPNGSLRYCLQDTFFACRRDPEMQLHLGLGPLRTVIDQ